MCQDVLNVWIIADALEVVIESMFIANAFEMEIRITDIERESILVKASILVFSMIANNDYEYEYNYAQHIIQKTTKNYRYMILKSCNNQKPNTIKN